MPSLPDHFQTYASQPRSEGQMIEFDFSDDLTDLFYVYYFGQLEEIEQQNFILDAGFPIHFYVQPIHTQQQIVLFDETQHGYNGLMLNMHQPDPSYPTLQLLSQTPLKIHIQLRYKTPFEKQKQYFDLHQHQITLINGDRMDWDEFKINAFDAIRIEFYNENEAYIFQNPIP